MGSTQCHKNLSTESSSSKHFNPTSQGKWSYKRSETISKHTDYSHLLFYTNRLNAPTPSHKIRKLHTILWKNFIYSSDILDLQLLLRYFFVHKQTQKDWSKCWTRSEYFESHLSSLGGWTLLAQINTAKSLLLKTPFKLTTTITTRKPSLAKQSYLPTTNNWIIADT